MRHEYFLFFITTCFIFTGCSKRERLNTEIYNIDFEQGFDTEQQMFISEIADSVEYIELKTPDGVVVTRIWNIIQFDDYLLIKARHDVLLFHKNGQFIKYIGSRGQGPGEYTVSGEIGYDRKNKEIVIADTRQLLFYNWEGNFLRSNRINESISEIGISDTIIWIGEVISSANTKYLAVAISLQGDTLAYIHNSLYGINKSDHILYLTNSQVKFFYSEKDFLYFKGDMSNDTIWKISGVSAEPYAFIDMGKYKMPVEYEAWYSSMETYLKNKGRYWSVCSMVEGDQYFFLLSNWRENSKQKKGFGAFKCMIFDKETKKTFSVKDNNGIGFTDDFRGGPPIWPRWASDDYYMNSIETYELLEMIEAGEYTPSPQLEELLSRIDDSSNDIVILIKRKK